MVGKVDDRGALEEPEEIRDLVERLRHLPPDEEVWSYCLVGLAQGLSETAACTRAGTTVKLAKRHRKEDALFEERWQEAIEAGTDRLEDRAFERAYNQSDYLMVALLKARRPHKYGDRVTVTERKEISWEPMTDAEWSEVYGGGDEVKALPAPKPDPKPTNGKAKR